MPNKCKCGCGGSPRCKGSRFCRGHRARLPQKRTSRLGREGDKAVPAGQRPGIRDLEWAAGFLEGEGCFRRSKTTETIDAAQVNPEPLQRIQRIFGGRIWHRKPQQENASPADMWYVAGPRARGVMFTLYALLTAKRRAQIRRALGR